MTCEVEFTPLEYPPFPDDRATAHLETFHIDELVHASLENMEEEGAGQRNVHRLLQTCQRQGCFYLDFRGPNTDIGEEDHDLVQDAGRMMCLLEPLFKLSREEKDRYIPPDPLALVGYKRVGATVVDSAGTPDTAEFFNLSKNDLCAADNSEEGEEEGIPGQGLSLAKQTKPTLKLKSPALPWPGLILAQQRPICEFMLRCHTICLQILTVLSIQAGLPPTTLGDLHWFPQPSGDVLRAIRGPPRPGRDGDVDNDNDNDKNKDRDKHIHTPLHRDFGTVTILFNWLGGLQLQPHPPEGDVLWVKPEPHRAIVLVGTALDHFLEGMSADSASSDSAASSFAAWHRVVPAPGVQGQFARYSLGYFLRPEDDVYLRKVVVGSVGMRKVDTEDAEDGPAVFTAKEWIRRQAKGLGFGRAE